MFMYLQNMEVNECETGIRIFFYLYYRTRIYFVFQGMAQEHKKQVGIFLIIVIANIL